MKNLYIIAGCNGAGKTTAAFTLLPEMLDCKEFVNADEIARGLSPFNPESVSIQAGRMMLERIDHLLKSGVDFGFETTLATKSFVRLIEKAKACGYFVTLIFFFISDVEIAIERVAIRVQEGGHFIAGEVVRRRYVAGLKNFVNLYIPVCDKWLVFNNSGPLVQKISEGSGDKVLNIFDKNSWNQIINFD